MTATYDLKYKPAYLGGLLMSAREERIARSVIDRPETRTLANLMDLYAIVAHRVTYGHTLDDRLSIEQPLARMKSVVMTAHNRHGRVGDVDVQTACVLLAAYALTGRMSKAYAVCTLPMHADAYLFACRQLASLGYVAPGLKAAELEDILLKEQPRHEMDEWRDVSQINAPALHAPENVALLLDLGRRILPENVPSRILNPGLSDGDIKAVAAAALEAAAAASPARAHDMAKERRV